jgi:hypothetical protein
MVGDIDHVGITNDASKNTLTEIPSSMAKIKTRTPKRQFFKNRLTDFRVGRLKYDFILMGIFIIKALFLMFAKYKTCKNCDINNQ